MLFLKKIFKKELAEVSDGASDEELYDVLLGKGYTETDIANQIKVMLGMSYDPSNVKVEGVDLNKIHKEHVLTNRCLPLKVENDQVQFLVNGMMDKNLKKKMNEMAVELGKTRGTASSFVFDFQFDRMVDEFFEYLQEGSTLNAKSKEKGFTSFSEDDWDAEYVTDDIIKKGVIERSTDIHIEPIKEGFRVRYRIDGIFSIIDFYRVDEVKRREVISRIKLKAGMKTEERRVGQDGRLEAMEYKGREFELRVSTMASTLGEKIAMRVLEKSSVVPEMRDLGFSKFYINGITQDMQKHNGLILNTGSVGSGKSTTQTTLLASLDAQQRNIYSIEDPVERTIDDVNHVCVHETKVSFEDHLETLLRQDPDIIAIGEIRNLKTMDMALKASLSGQMVFATMHTNSAVEALYRLFNMGVEPYELGAALQGIGSQRLVRTLCPYCKRKREISSTERSVVETMMSKYDEYNEFSMAKFDYVYEACGCDHCNHTGYHGRTVLAEYLSVSKELKNYIGSGDVTREKILELAEETFVPIELDALNKVLLGRTAISQVVKVI